LNIAWKYAVIFPAISNEITKAHLIYFVTAAFVGLSIGISGDYFRARAKIAKFKREALDDRLRRNVNGENPSAHVSNELRIIIDQEKSWHESWWGVLLLSVIGGIILAIILNPFGLN
jgi:hypothetical protein